MIYHIIFILLPFSLIWALVDASKILRHTGNLPKGQLLRCRFYVAKKMT